MGEDKAVKTDSQVRESVYDWVRILATFFVVVGHSAYVVMEVQYGGIDFLDRVSEWSPLYYNSSMMQFFGSMAGWVYKFHMPLFFVLSGAVLRLKPIENVDLFCKRKFMRLVIPYYVYGLLFMIPVKYLGGFYSTENLQPAFYHFWVGTDSGHLWFLLALFWCMMVFVLVHKLLIRLGCTSDTVRILVCAVIQLFANDIPIQILKFHVGMRYIFWFALGFCFAAARKKQGKTLTVIIKLLFLSLVLILNEKCQFIYDKFVILVGSYWTYTLALNLSKVLGFIERTVGYKVVVRNLFYIYLFHDPLEYVILRGFVHYNVPVYDWGVYLYLFCRIFGVIVISIVLGELIELIKRKGRILCKNLKE